MTDATETAAQAATTPARFGVTAPTRLGVTAPTRLGVTAPAGPAPASRQPGSRQPESRQPGSRPPGSRQPAGQVPAGGARPHTYVGDAFDGDLHVGGAPTLAHDGEPAGLARVTLAMRPAQKQSPAPSRLVALCAWATALGIAGLLLAARSGFALLTNPPGWFMPSSAAAGIVGIVCTGAAFLTAHKRIVPWTLLGVATCAIGASVLLISLLGTGPTISSIP